MASIDPMPHPLNRMSMAFFAALAAFVVVLPSQAQAITDAPQRSAPGLAQMARSPLDKGSLHRKLAKLASKAPGKSGFYVYDVDAKRKHVLFDRSQGRRRKLASNEKLFTTTTALHVLGAGGTIATRVKRGRHRHREGAAEGQPLPRRRRGSLVRRGRRDRPCQ